MSEILYEKNFWWNFFWQKKNSGNKYCLAKKIISGSWQVAGGSWQMAVSRWQVAGGMWPNCLGAVRKAGISCSHQLAVGGKIVTEKEEQLEEEEYSQHSMY